jgi:hypothetical protein
MTKSVPISTSEIWASPVRIERNYIDVDITPLLHAD